MSARPLGAEGLPAWLAARSGELSKESSMEYLARHSHSFRYAARFLPPPYDVLVADVYAFCRFTDDLVDGDRETPAATLRARLADWRGLAERAHGGSPSGFALLDKPLVEMGRRGIPFAYAAELIEGVAMDLGEEESAAPRPSESPGASRPSGSPGALRRYTTLAELDVYSYRVASVVGLWLTRLVGVHDERVLARAADLGHAMQLTNILRDVGEDWRNGRLYLPLDVLARHGITEGDIARAADPAVAAPAPHGWAAAMEELMAAADARYRRSFDAVRALPAFFRAPVAVSGMVYRDIHNAIRRNGYDNLTRRAHTSRLRKLWLGVRARLWLARRPGRPSPSSVPIEAQGRASAWEADASVNPAGHATAARPTSQARSSRVVAWAVIALTIGLAVVLATAGETPGAREGREGGEGKGAASGTRRGDVPGLAETAARARAEIARADSALRLMPGDRSLHLRKLRALHAASAHDESLLPASRAALAAAQRDVAGPRRETPAGGEAEARDAIWLAYRGALDVVEARHAFWPPARLTALRRGLDRLDEAVRRAPDDVDIRYLRLTSTYYLPGLLQRDDTVRDDFKALAELLPGAREVYSAAWYVTLADFVLRNAPLTPGERQRLRQARAHAASPSPRG